MLTPIQEQSVINVGASPLDTYNVLNVATATTTLVKTGAGKLHAISINTTAVGAITVYDNTSAAGTKLATFKTSIAEGQYFFNCPFTTGLTIVTAGASDITILYK